MAAIIPNPPELLTDWNQRFFGPLFVRIFRKLGKFERTAEEVRELVSLLRLPMGAAILDVPCGFGRHSKVLHEEGFSVSGIDSSAFLLRLARRYNRGPNYQLRDMRFPPRGQFSAILNLWTSFGNLATRKEDRDALVSWHTALTHGGQMVMEISDLERVLAENSHSASDNGYKCKVFNGVIEEAWFDFNNKTAIISYELDGERIVGRTNIYSKDELVSLFIDVGFTGIKTYGRFDGSPKSPLDRLVIHAFKE